MNGRWRCVTIASAALALTLVGVGNVAAHPDYSGCADCHGDFRGPTSPQGTIFPSADKHEMHRASGSMNTECALCHTSPSFSNVVIGSSDGTANNPGLGCNGCHGRDYGGALGVSGVGLRAHHEANGVTCATCHPNDPAPLPESVTPPYYGTVDTNADDSCNVAPGHKENWSIGDTQGQDNDGDNVYDEADSDCAPIPGDMDGDGDLDLADYAQFAACMTGPGGGILANCDAADIELDLDVDLVDFSQFETQFPIP